MWQYYRDGLHYHFTHPLVDNKSFEGEPIGGQLLVNKSCEELRAHNIEETKLDVDNVSIATTNVVNENGLRHGLGAQDALTNRFSAALRE